MIHWEKVEGTEDYGELLAGEGNRVSGGGRVAVYKLERKALLIL